MTEPLLSRRVPIIRKSALGGVDIGLHGPIYKQYTGKPLEAMKHLIRMKRGEVPGAFYHPELGEVDLVWGNKKGGLSHIIEEHVKGQKDLKLPDLAREFSSMKIDPASSSSTHAILVSDKLNAAVRLDYDGVAKRWLVSAYGIE